MLPPTPLTIESDSLLLRRHCGSVVFASATSHSHIEKLAMFFFFHFFLSFFLSFFLLEINLYLYTQVHTRIFIFVYLYVEMEASSWSTPPSSDARHLASSVQCNSLAAFDSSMACVQSVHKTGLKNQLQCLIFPHLLLLLPTMLSLCRLFYLIIFFVRCRVPWNTWANVSIN